MTDRDRYEDEYEDGYEDRPDAADPRYYPTEQAYPGMEGMEGMEQMGQEPWAMGPMSEPGWATRKLGPMPVWAWFLIAGGVSFGGYLYYQNRQKREAEETTKKEERRGRRKPTRANKAAGSGKGDDETDNARHALPADTKGWYPSRTSMTTKLEKWLDKNKQREGVTIFSDADEAVKHVKAPSPLITLKLEKNAKFDEKALEKSTRREGLYPVRNGDVVGLYPTENTKRGKMWETYIDDLRDEGQAV